MTLSGLGRDFALSTVPDLGTLQVRLYADDSEESLVRTLTRDVDFSYVTDGNLLRFVEAQVPPAEHYVLAEYTPLPTGAVSEPQAEGAP